MKKTYIIPSSEVIKIQTTGMLAVSSTVFSGDPASVTGTGDAAEYENALSRELDLLFE